MIYIGIDPGVHCGYAVWSSISKKMILTANLTFWDCIDNLDTDKQAAQENKTKLCVIVEDPGLNKPVFPKKGAQKFGAVQRVAQNVGMNKAYARLIIEYCEKYGIAYEAVKPSTKKWDAAMFRAVTGIKGRVSQHVRDAVKLVWGRI